jgi:hypothetical protein
MTFTGLAALGLLAAAGGGVAWLIVKGQQQQKKADFERSVLSRKLGWHYDGMRDGRIDYRFRARAGELSWSMWYDSDRGDDSPTPKARWSSENLRTPRLALLILGRRRFGLESGTFGRLFMGIVSGVATAVSARGGVPDRTEFYESAVPLEEGSSGFRERFAVALAPDMPRGWLDDGLQKLLMQWPADRRGRTLKAEDAVEVSLGPAGLSITVQKMPDDMAHWQHLARLGEHLATQLAPSSR